MKSETLKLRDDEGVELNVYRWSPDAGAPRALVQVSHGLAERAGRYGRLAERLCAAGYEVWADDHRGHGLSAAASGGRGELGPGGWDAVVRGLRALSDRMVAERPGLPLFLLGHSWGSFLAQDYAQRWGGRLAGLILSGSAGHQPAAVTLMAPLVSRLLIALKGPDAPSEFTYAMTFKAFNKAFLPSPTGGDNDWLSRDLDWVRETMADPLCAGFRLSNRSALAMVLGLNRLWRPEGEAAIPKDLPILVMAGTEDPVGARLAELRPLVERYRALGIADLETRYYEGARHEILNETNRGEVIADILAWLDARLARGAAR